MKTVHHIAICRWMKSERTKWRGIRWGLITQIVVVESEYILSHPQGPKCWSIHKQPLCCRQRATIFNDDSQQVTPPFSLSVASPRPSSQLLFIVAADWSGHSFGNNNLRLGEAVTSHTGFIFIFWFRNEVSASLSILCWPPLCKAQSSVSWDNKEQDVCAPAIPGILLRITPESHQGSSS